MIQKNNFFQSVLKYKNFILLLIASLLLGFDTSFTAWFAYVPVYFLIESVSLKKAWLYGGIFGILFTIVYAFWLFKFSIPAMLCIWILFFFLYALQFELLKLSSHFIKNFSFVFYIFIPLLFEYIRTLGFAGFNYTLLGYTQYKNLYLIQIARFSGVFGISFMLYYSSAVIFQFLNDFFNRRIGIKNLISVIFLFVLISSSIIYGFVEVSLLDKRDSRAEKITVSAIQHNPDPKKTGIKNYSEDVENLIQLTENALSENPDIKIVVWPETSVVPSIIGNYDNEKSPERKKLIRHLLDYIDSKKITFVIGNFHSDNGDDYNSVYVFTGGKNVNPPEPEVYRKNHLVPFSEYLPFSERLPELKKFLNSRNNFLWTPGKERNVFVYKDSEIEKSFVFCTPVCFEDTFGNDVRKFYKNGARAIISLGNDSWSASKRCQVQHLKMAVFRCVENHIPAVRSTASGESCIISSCGRIVKRSRSFEKNYVTDEIPVISEE